MTGDAAKLAGVFPTPVGMDRTAATA